jgi:hypothetical protein
VKGFCGRVWRYCRGEPGFYFALFIAIWMAAWIANGLKVSMFDLDRLRDLFFFVFGKYLADSGLNSPWQKPIKGEMEHENRNTQ